MSYVDEVLERVREKNQVLHQHSSSYAKKMRLNRNSFRQ